MALLGSRRLVSDDGGARDYASVLNVDLYFTFEFRNCLNLLRSPIDLKTYWN